MNKIKLVSSKELQRGSYFICRHEPMNLLGRREPSLGRFKPVIMLIPIEHDFNRTSHEQIFAFDTIISAKHFMKHYLEKKQDDITWISNTQVISEHIDLSSQHNLVYNYTIKPINKSSLEYNWGELFKVTMNDIIKLKNMDVI